MMPLRERRARAVGWLGCSLVIADAIYASISGNDTDAAAAWGLLALSGVLMVYGISVGKIGGNPYDGGL